MDDVLFGENWNNQDIDHKTRCIITVVALMSSGITDSSLKYHLENAKKAGVTRKKIAAIITHAAFYVGWPKAWAVFYMAKGKAMGEMAMIRDLIKGNVAGLLFRFSLPFVLANLLQTLYGMADMIVVGQYVGSAGLFAVGIGSDLLSILTLLCTGFATAGQIMISQYVGKNDRTSMEAFPQEAFRYYEPDAEAHYMIMGEVVD